MPVRVTKSTTLALADGEADIRVTKTTLLMLAGVAHPVYVTKATVLALVASGCLTKLCQCWKIVRRDGISFHYTTHNEPVMLHGAEYSPCESLSASAFESGLIKTKSGTSGDVEATGIISMDGISEHDLAHGLFDGAEVTVYQVSWNPEDVSGGKFLARGTITESTQGDSGYTINVSSLSVKLSQTPMLDVYSPSCRYDIGVSPCPVTIAAYQYSGTVTGTVPASPVQRTTCRQFFDSSIAQADGYYNGGRIVWLTGDNAGQTSEIKNYYNANDLVSLWVPMPHPIAIGDTFTLTPGCNKSMTDHQIKFSLDEESFGGQPGLPGNDVIMRSI